MMTRLLTSKKLKYIKKKQNERKFYVRLQQVGGGVFSSEYEKKKLE